MISVTPLSSLAGWLAAVARFELAGGDRDEIEHYSLALLPTFGSAAMLQLADPDYADSTTRSEYGLLPIALFRDLELEPLSAEDYKWVLGKVAFRPHQTPAELAQSWRALYLAMDWDGELSHLIGVAAGYVDELDEEEPDVTALYQRMSRFVEDERDAFNVQWERYLSESATAKWIGEVLHD